ncbi:DUF4062 domain-containing protein [Alicyclobacillus macrosporangiidus]|uniref:DUF4062 domain-containing protein n=1 Tax=Alicyclobacillus macrosporangiidus TaxID=392015 RepID=UPI00068CB7D5|nr:DUF4062 domain-containing protein [Alicyclobacillus macrosporangiidus]
MRQRVFISSVISGYEHYRQAVADSVDYLDRHGLSLQPWRMEVDKPAPNNEPQTACLHEVKACPIYILLVGPRYGFVNPASGISATHEEFRTAVTDPTKTILVFVEESDVEWDEEQKAFLQEVGDYVKGRFYRKFTNAFHLQLEVERAFRELFATGEWAPEVWKIRELIQEESKRLAMPDRYMSLIASPSVRNRNAVQLNSDLEKLLLQSPEMTEPRLLELGSWNSDCRVSTDWIEATSLLPSPQSHNPWAILRVYRTGHVLLSTITVFTDISGHLELLGAKLQKTLWSFLHVVRSLWDKYQVIGNLGLDLGFHTKEHSRIEPDFVKTDGMAFKREMRDLQFR